MKELKDIELIDRYLDGSLTELEKTALENRLKTDAGLQQTLEDVKEVIFAVQLSEEERVRAILREEQDKLSKSKVVPFPKPYLLRGLAIAASLAFVAVAAYWLLVKPKEEPFDFVHKHNTWVAINGGSKKGSVELPQNNDNILATYGQAEGTKLIEGLTLYDDEKFEQAAQVLMSIRFQNDTLSLFQANALIKAHKNAEGIGILEKIAPNSLLRMERDWYLAMAYLKMGDKVKAKEILSAITQNPQHDWQPNAQDLLEKNFKQ